MTNIGEDQRLALAKIIDPDAFPSCDPTFETIQCRKEREIALAKADACIAALRASAAQGEPVAWVIGRDNNANDRGFIDAMAWSEGEFTTPLYAHPVIGTPDNAAIVQYIAVIPPTFGIGDRANRFINETGHAEGVTVKDCVFYPSLEGDTLL